MLRVIQNEVTTEELSEACTLDEIAREGARRMLVSALEAEVEAYLQTHRDERDREGKALVVLTARLGHARSPWAPARSRCARLG